KELYNLLKNLNSDGMDDVFPAVVKSVDKSSFTVDVDYQGNELGNVRLKALVGEAADEDGFVVFPAVDSVVLVKKVSAGLLAVWMVSEIESLVWKIGDKQYSVDKNGHRIANGDDTLLQVITMIIESVQKVIVFQGQNPDYMKLQKALDMVKTILK
ncbi:MAG: hypothetical protein DI598_21015, partial [Pseudopedobacter saltans]